MLTGPTDVRLLLDSQQQTSFLGFIVERLSRLLTHLLYTQKVAGSSPRGTTYLMTPPVGQPVAAADLLNQVWDQ